MTDQPCHTGAAARVCGYCAEHQARTERIRLAWHDATCEHGRGCRYRTIHAQGGTAEIDSLRQFLACLDQLEKDPAW